MDECTLYQCSLCPGLFNRKKNLYSHMRKQHNVAPDMGGKIVCPLICGARFRSQKGLREHLEQHHGQVIESEEFDFSDMTAFKVWKTRLEADTGQSWVRRVAEKTLKCGEFKSYYSCNRSGEYMPKKSECKRRRPQTLKIGTTCPSIMEVSRYKKDDTVKVLWYKQHLGHTEETPRQAKKRQKKKKADRKIAWDVCAVLPAAGMGERMGGEAGQPPKQYIPIHQKPIVCYTVDAFLKLPYIKKVVVVASPDSLDLMLRTLGETCQLEGEKLMVTEGGLSRHASIHSGLKALQTCCPSLPELVIIHDAVRPFVSEDAICDVIHGAKEFGAAGLTCPLVSTVVSADSQGFLDTSLDRNKYLASEMPQAFNYELILKAYELSTAYDFEYGTECLHLMQKYANINPKLLPGTADLWKVTHHKDLYTAAAIAKKNQSVCIVNSHTWNSLATLLGKCIEKSFKTVQTIVKLRDVTLTKYQNIVQIGEETDPYPVLQRLTALAEKAQPQYITMAYVFVNAFDPTLNYLEFQKQAKYCSKLLKGANILVYFVLYTGATDTIEELGEMLRSLLFDSNPSISGSVFLS